MEPKELEYLSLQLIPCMWTDDDFLPCMRFSKSKYGFLGKVYEMQDFEPPAPELLVRLRVIIDEAFGGRGKPRPG